jgi:hypothetical protein
MRTFYVRALSIIATLLPRENFFKAPEQSLNGMGASLD